MAIYNDRGSGDGSTGDLQRQKRWQRRFTTTKTVATTIYNDGDGGNDDLRQRGRGLGDS